MCIRLHSVYAVYRTEGILLVLMTNVSKSAPSRTQNDVYLNTGGSERAWSHSTLVLGSVVQTLAAWWDLSLACSFSLSCARHRSEYHTTIRLAFRFCFSFQDEDCSVFKKEYCSLRLDKIMMLDTDIAGPAECQVCHIVACFSTADGIFLVCSGTP